MALLEIHQLQKRFEHKTIIEDISFTVHEGEFFSILGPSGCGKSTLLRLIAGLEQTDAGRIFVAGKNITLLPPHARPTNMMFQSYALFPHMSVEKNIAFGLQQEKLPKTEIRQRVKAMLALVKMEEFADRKPRNLSGGQQQRVALARALAKQPKLLLLDEPLTALDKKLREHMRSELVNIQKQIGTTFILVSHDQEEVMSMASRVALMDQGKIVQIDKAETLYNHPCNRFAAEFFGSINHITAVVDRCENNVCYLKIDRLDKLITTQTVENFTKDEVVSLMIRPEKLQIHPQPLADTACTLNGRVRNRTYLGNKTIYDVELTPHWRIQVQKTHFEINDTQFCENQQVFISWHPKNWLIFTNT